MNEQQKMQQQNNTYDNDLMSDLNESFISEECWYCHEELIKIEDIFVDLDDHYLCHNCKVEYNIVTVPCIEILKEGIE